MKKKIALLAALLVVACALPREVSVPRLEREALTISGEETYAARCAACHPLIAPEQHSFAVWKEKVGEFAPLAELNEVEEAAVLAFLRSGARSDGGGP